MHKREYMTKTWGGSALHSMHHLRLKASNGYVMQTSHGHVDSKQTSHVHVDSKQMSHGHVDSKQTSHVHVDSKQTSHGHVDSKQTSHVHVDSKQTSHVHVDSKQTSHVHVDSKQTSHGHVDACVTWSRMLLCEVDCGVFDRVVRLVDNDWLTAARRAKCEVSVDHPFFFDWLSTQTQFLSSLTMNVCSHY